MTAEQIKAANEVLEKHEIFFDPTSPLPLTGQYDRGIGLSYSLKNDRFTVSLWRSAMGESRFRQEVTEVLNLLNELKTAGLPVAE